MFLCDTNVLILAIAGKEPDAFLIRRLITDNKLSLSVIVVAEFLARPSAKEQKFFKKLLANLPVLEINQSTAQIAAYYRRQSLKNSRSSLLDCFLAAQTKEHGLILVTNNTADFPMRDIKILPPEKLV